MIQITEQTGAVIRVDLTEHVGVEEVQDQLLPWLQPARETSCRRRFLLHFAPDFAGFKGWTHQSIGEAIAETRRHGSGIERIAVVGGSNWIQLAAQLLDFVVDTRIQFYAAGEIEAALVWLNAGDSAENRVDGA